MITPRLLIDQFGDALGLKASLPGFDVTVAADDDDPTKRSFNSNWSNLVKIAVAGYSTATATAPGSGPYFTPHGLSYVPFVEGRIYSGSTFYDDDYINTVFSQESNQPFIFSNHTNVSFGLQGLTGTTKTVVYAVYRLEAEP